MKEFGDILSFAAHLGKIAASLPSSEKTAIEGACKLVQAEAMAEIGHYQGAAGPFAAWKPLTEATMEDRVKQGYAANQPLLRTGELRASIEYSLGDKEGRVGSNNDKAVWHELGTTTIPPRSFLGGAAFRMEPKIRVLFGRTMVAALTGPGVPSATGGQLPTVIPIKR